MVLNKTQCLLIALIVPVAMALLTSPVIAAEKEPLESKQDKVSYGLGFDLMRNLKQHNAEVDIDLLIQGIRDGAAGVKPPVAEKELRKAVNAFQADMARKDVLMRRALYVTNNRKGEEFLAANKKKDGVVALPSGLQYRVLKMGEGKKPADGDTVEANYRALHIDGTEALKSEPGKPVLFKVGANKKQLTGLSEALKLMPAGSKWELYVPGRMAYGERGSGLDVEPNETLIFEMELVKIK